MRPLVDPSLLTPGFLSWVFLAVAGVILPTAAIAQQRTLSGDRPAVSRAQIYSSAVVTHAVILALALLAAHELDAILFPPYRFQGTHVLLAVATLALGLVPLLPALEPGDARMRGRATLIAPGTRAEHAAFAGVAVSAGVVEEIAYRGALPLLLARILGGWWIPALLSAISFGAAHCFQGWRGALLAGAIGLAAQALVGLTGTLIFAIVVHIVHDLIAGLVIARRARLDAGGASLAVS